MEATERREARPACKQRARHAGDGMHSVADEWECGTFWAGVVIAVSFGLMFLYAGVAF